MDSEKSGVNYKVAVCEMDIRSADRFYYTNPNIYYHNLIKFGSQNVSTSS